MTPLSQRDDRWKNIKLGWSDDTTIGSHGCLITAISMLWNTTPDKVNEWLKNNNGYVNLNLVDWTKVPGFKWRGWSYNNAEILETIDKYGSCIVEVDFNTNPEDGSHFVVFTGNKKLNDPWDGKEKPTSSFSTFYGYATIDPSKNPLKGEQMSNELEECLKAHTKLMNEIKNKDEVISTQANDLLTLQKEKECLIDERDSARDDLVKTDELRKKWYDQLQVTKTNLDVAQKDSARFQKLYTEAETKLMPQHKLLRRIYDFVIAMDEIYRRRSKVA